MKVSLFSEKKKRLIKPWDIDSFGVILTYGHRRVCKRQKRSDSGDDPKEKEEKNSVGDREEGEETLLSPSSFPLLFSLHSMASARSNAAIHKENFFIPQYHELMIKGL